MAKLFGLVKQFTKKILKNPIKAGIVAFLVWRILKDEDTEVENMNQIESIKVIKKKGDKELIFDSEVKKYAVVQGRKITMFNDEKSARKTFGESISERLNVLREALDPVTVFIKKDINGTYFVSAVLFASNRSNKPYSPKERRIKDLEKLPNMKLNALTKKIKDVVKSMGHQLTLKKESISVSERIDVLMEELSLGDKVKILAGKRKGKKGKITNTKNQDFYKIRLDDSGVIVDEDPDNLEKESFRQGILSKIEKDRLIEEMPEHKKSLIERINKLYKNV